MTWIWENKNWPDFTWNSEMINPLCREITFFLGTLNAKIGFAEEKEASLSELDSLLNNIVKSSSIEGESVNAFSVRSSLAKRLKINIKKFPTTDRTEGLAELQLDIFQNIDKELSLKRLFIWHHWLFPASENWKIPVGKLRGYSPMHVVSGRIDNPKIHFEAPPRKELVNEMKSMLDWFEETRNKLDFDPFIRSGIIHLWFLTIHPFEDGNGRLARIVSELALAQFEEKTSKLYSVSSVILDKRKEYYFVLEQTQKGNLDITKWLYWYLGIIKQAIQEAIKNIDRVLFKTNFWKAFHKLNLLPEQKKVLNLMLDSKDSRFDSGISAMQYQKITKVSKATATRHLTELTEIRCLKKLPGGGRSTRYVLKDYKV